MACRYFYRDVVGAWGFVFEITRDECSYAKIDPCTRACPNGFADFPRRRDV